MNNSSSAKDVAGVDKAPGVRDATSATESPGVCAPAGVGANGSADAAGGTGSLRQLAGTLLAVLLLAACMCLGRGCAGAEGQVILPPSSVAIAADDPVDETDLARLARTDQTALLEMCLTRYDELPVTDYTCTLTRQEVLRGRTQPRQQGLVKFRDQPLSVAIHWTVNPPGGDRVVYVEGLYANDDGVSRMVVRPAGWAVQLATGGSVLREPTAKDVLDKTLRPITDFGFRNALVSILRVGREGDRIGAIRREFEGAADVGGRPCLALMRAIDEPWRDDIPHRTRIFIDRDLLLPIRLEGYDGDGELMWEYQFDDVRLNVGLGDEDFTPEANGIAPPG